MRYQIITFVWLIVTLIMPTHSLGNDNAPPNTPPGKDGYRWETGVIDIRSTISDGSHTPDSLADLAHQRGIGILLLSDHERLAVEYGVFPLRKFLKYTKELPSVSTLGWNQYLAAVDTANHRHDDVLLIPGLETSPFYYWSGLPFLRMGLTLHNWERHLLVFGLETHQDWTELPTVGNRNGFSWQGQPPVLLLFAGVFLIGIMLMRWNGWLRKTGIILSVLALTGGIDAVRLGQSHYDQYHGDQKILPYQKFIDYVTSREGLVFWNHPGTNSGKRPLPPIQLDTPPYSEVLTESDNYTGIAVLSGENFDDAEPGGRWDQVLMEYCLDRRQRPAWGIATADFHQDGRHGEQLGDYSTIFAVRSLNQQEVLDALRHGRMYAVKGQQANQDRLVEFAITDTTGTKRGISGEIIELSEDKARIDIGVESLSGSPHPLTIKVIENGKVITTLTEQTPLRHHLEIHPQPGKKNYYRLDITSDCCRLISNPIFTRRPDTHPNDHSK